jgi:hypothetical protein
MTMTDIPRRTARASSPAPSPARQLQTAFAAVRVSFTWLGVRKTLSPSQKAQAAEPFGAEEKYLSAAKKLLDTADPLFRELTGLRHRIVSYWKGMSVPYPEPGLRLIRQDQIESFHTTLQDLQQQLQAAVTKLDAHYEALKASARTTKPSRPPPGSALAASTAKATIHRR